LILVNHVPAVKHPAGIFFSFVAAWHGENDTVESAVMLPKMHLRR